jgi:LmbE family N-acetylglucosaminyl deacetylase
MTRIVAAVAAHPDDEVLGCGGTLARMATEGDQVHILLLADGESARQASSSEGVPEKIGRRRQSAQAAADVLGASSVEVHALPDNRLDGIDRLEIIKLVENFLSKHNPEIVFTHFSGDLNIDHRRVHEAVVTASRPLPSGSVRELLFFEVPSATEWGSVGSAEAFRPNWFVDISGTMETKLRALACYQDEMREFPHPRSVQAIEALARWRGASSGLNAAEAFVLGRKISKG